MQRHVMSTGCAIALMIVFMSAIDGLTADGDVGDMKRIKAENWTVPDIDLAMRRIPAAGELVIKHQIIFTRDFLR